MSTIPFSLLNVQIRWWPFDHNFSRSLSYAVVIQITTCVLAFSYDILKASLSSLHTHHLASGTRPGRWVVQSSTYVEAGTGNTSRDRRLQIHKRIHSYEVLYARTVGTLHKNIPTALEMVDY